MTGREIKRRKNTLYEQDAENHHIHHAGHGAAERPAGPGAVQPGVFLLDGPALHDG